MIEKRGLVTISWPFLARVGLKTLLLFLFCNGVYALLMPLEAIGHLSVYNYVAPGRLRLPYGEDITTAYNLSLSNIPAMMASHTVSRPKMIDEYRVLLFGDSATWGWFLTNEATVAGQINEAEIVLADGRRVVAYNLGYPIMSLSKDLLLLEAGMEHQPDLIVWLMTLRSLPRTQQLVPPLVQENGERMVGLIEQYQLDLPTSGWAAPRWPQRTLVGQRRQLADWLRLQLVAGAWGVTGIDQMIPVEIPLRQSDFDETVAWQGYEGPTSLATALAFEVLAAGMTMAGDIPVLLVNEPMFVSNGRYSDRHYNAFYPRWAYDQYRTLMMETAVDRRWCYLDWWDLIPATEFGDSPVHLTEQGSTMLAERLSQEILKVNEAKNGRSSSPCRVEKVYPRGITP